MKRKFSKKFTTFIIIAVCVCVVLMIKILIAASTGNLPETQSARSKGDPNASVKVVEFIDFQCPACAQGSKILKKFMSENPKEIQLELRYYPLPMHSHAFLSAYYAECAARQDRFWPFEDLLIERQDQWAKLYDAKPYLDILAKNVGLNLERLDACVKDPATQSVILADKDEGRKLGVQSTPTYFINGKMMVGVTLLEEKLKTFKQ